MLKSLLVGEFMLSGLPATVAVAAVASFAYLAGLMSKIDESPGEQIRDLDGNWCEGQEFAKMTDDVLALTRRALNDSHRLSKDAHSE
jgi:hypothetical protein